MIVQTLLERVASGGLAIQGLIVAADEIAASQWRQLLSDHSGPSGWQVHSADEALVEHVRFPRNLVLIADELEVYLNQEFSAAAATVDTILGLCGNPGGLGQIPAHFRKVIGSPLAPIQPNAKLNFLSLAEQLRTPRTELGKDSGDDDVRERLHGVDDPQDILRYYLKRIHKFPLLSPEDEIELGKQVEAGLLAEKILRDASAGKIRPPHYRDLRFVAKQGAIAKERFILSNLRLALHIARRYSSRLELTDAIQCANIGLIHAVEKFDYTKGYKFSTYATWWIRQAITRAIADQSNLIRIPAHQFEADNHIVAEWRRQSREAGTNASVHDIANALEVGIEEVRSAVNRHRAPISLEALTAEGIEILDPDEPTPIDGAIDALSHEELASQLGLVFDTLSEREREVIKLRYGFHDDKPRTLDDIGSIYGVTRERIRQIEAKAFLKLRHPSRFELLLGCCEGLPNPSVVTSDSQLKPADLDLCPQERKSPPKPRKRSVKHRRRSHAR